MSGMLHISHYGRLCPIETPEGANIGLIASLSIYSEVDDYGFLVSPYRKVDNNVISRDVSYLRADDEEKEIIVPCDSSIGRGDKISTELAHGRYEGNFTIVPREKITYADVSPKQLIGISAALIPFLEHDDANRALMGSNMQRQAVPLLCAEAALVGTGMEKFVAQNSGMVVKAEENGTVSRVTADKICIGDKEYPLRKFVGLNERTCMNQRPTVEIGHEVKRDDIIADSAAVSEGELALGRNVLVAVHVLGRIQF